VDPLLHLVGPSSNPTSPNRDLIRQRIDSDAISQGARDATSNPLVDFTSATLHNLIKPLHGAAQFLENAAASGASKLPDNPISRAITQTAAEDNTAQQQWEQQYQTSTPDNPASYAGAAVGTLAPFVGTGAARGLQAAGDLVASVLPSRSAAILPKVVSGATQGAVLGAASPVDSAGDYWAQKAKQVGLSAATVGGLPIVGAAGRAVADAAAPFVNPGSIVRRALQSWEVTPQAIDATELVPGSKPTLAQAVANPNVVAAEKALLRNNPTYQPLFEARTNANNDARWAVVNGIAQTPDAVDRAIAARSQQTQPLIDKLLTNGNAVPVGGILDQLDALAKSPLGMRPAIGGAAQDVAAQIRRVASTSPDGSDTISPAHLDAIRQNVKDFLAKYAPNGAVSSQQQAAFEPVRTAIVDAIEGANPGYRDYLAKYAQLSRPVNTMEAGQSIVDALASRAAGSSGTPNLSLTGFNSQLRKALGRPYGIAPVAESALRGVQADLQRSTISNSLRVPGSDTSYNLQAPGWLGRALYGQNFQGGRAVPALMSMTGAGLGLALDGGLSLSGLAHAAGYGTAAGAAGLGLSHAASRRVNGLLADALLNPEAAAKLVAESPRSAIASGILARVPQLGLLTARPAETIGMPGLLSAGVR
jgi:hypothetical protein